MAFNGVGRMTLKAGESMPVWVSWGLSDQGAQTIRANPELGINLRAITSDQGKAIGASFSQGEYQSIIYTAIVRCEQVDWLPSGNPPNPISDVLTFSLQGGGNT